MAKLYPVTLYYNTGYNTGNIPDSPARLSEYTSKSYPPVFLRQDYGTATIRINATWEEVRDADYASMEAAEGTTYWVIPQAITMLTDHTAEITMVLDPLTTVGGISALTVVSGWALRAHVTDDTPYSNILPEPWAPSSRLVMRGYEVVHNPSSEDINITIAATTCDLTKIRDYTADVYSAGEASVTGERVVVPHVPILQAVKGTEVGISRDGDAKASYTLPGIYLWVYGDDRGSSAGYIADCIAALNSLGLRGSLLALYTLSLSDVTLTWSTLAGIYNDVLLTALTGQSRLETSTMPYKYGDVRNNKAYALYNKYTLTAVASGNSVDYEAHDIYHDGDETPTWISVVDPSPTGTVYIGTKYYEGRETHRLEQAVASLPWINAGYTYTESGGASVGMLNAQRKNDIATIGANFAQQRSEMDYARTQVTNAIGAVEGLFNVAAPVAGAPGNIAGGISKIVGAGANAAMDYAYHALDTTERQTQLSLQMGDNLFGAQAAANIVAPELAFPVAANMAAYYGHIGVACQVTLSDNDLQRFDDFLSAYGYARDTKFIASMLSNRTKHNYIKTSGCHVSVDGAPQWLVSLIDKMFDAGIQIWHVKPSQDSLINNPVRS